MSVARLQRDIDEVHGASMIGLASRRPTQMHLRRARSSFFLVPLMLVASVCVCGGGADETGDTTALTDDPTATTSTVPDVSTSGNSSASTSTSSTTGVDDCTTLLKNGCESEEVRRLQRLLQRKIDADVDVDGKFGDETEGALDAFERKCDICVPDGQIRVDVEEWDELDSRKDLPQSGGENSPEV